VFETAVGMIAQVLLLVFHHFTCKPLRAIYRIENALLMRNRFPSKTLCE